MRKIGMLVLAAVMACAMVAIADEAAAPKPEAKAAGCPACTKDAKCAKCAGDISKMHVLAVKDGVATLCGCASDCKCTVKADDATKCSCGKDIVKCSLKGKFVCADGKCLTIADKAGKCACGKDLVEVK